MKTDRKTKAEKSSPKLKDGNSVRRAASKSAPSNGKHALATYEHIPIGIVESSLEGKYINVNEEFCRISGYEKGELLQHGIRDFTHEEDYPIDVKLHQKLVAGEIPFYKLEKRYVRKDGEIIWVELTRSMVRDADGKPLYSVGAVLDISDRKHVEKVLHESVERLRLATEAAQMFTWEWDFQSRIYTLADNFTQVIGFSADLLPKNSVETIYRLSPAEDVQAIAEAIAKAIESHSDVHSLQCRAINPENSQTVWLEVSAKIVYDHEGNPQRMFGVAQNITENKQAEDALRQSEERFVRFMEHLPGLAWIKDVQGHYMYANATAEKAFSTPREKLYGRTDQDLFPPEVAAQFKKNDERALTDGKGVQVIETLEHEDGVLHYSLVSKFPIPGPDGNIALIGGTGFDITERKRVEEALHTSEERYRNLFDFVPVAVYTCDGNGLIQEYNQRAVELWGREPEKNNPKEKYSGSLKIFYPDGRFMSHEESPMSRMLHGETLQPHELEILIERPDGVRKNVIAHPLSLRNERGEIVEAINCLYDITERIQAEEALRQLNLQLESRVQSRTAKLRSVNQSLRDEIAERKQVQEALARSEQEYRFLFQSSPLPMWVIDNESKSFVTINQAALEHYGYSREEFLSLNIDNIHPQEDLQGFLQTYELARSHEGLLHLGEWRHIKKDGSVINVDLKARDLSLGDRSVRLKLINDITERKRAEQALHESRRRLQILSQRLVEVQEEERRAIARELHDRVGQSLSALNINLIIMRDQLPVEAAQRMGTRFDDSMHLVSETITLVRDVMSNLRPAVLDDYGLEAALQSYKDEFTFRYGIKVVMAKSNPPIPRLGPSVEMTFLRIAQEAMMNVARHAQANQVNLSLQQENETICLTIQDNGVGIQSLQEANRPGSHGLTIMRERADAFGGSLKVGTVPGRGTKIEVRIPFEKEKGSQDQTQKEMRA